MPSFVKQMTFIWILSSARRDSHSVILIDRESHNLSVSLQRMKFTVNILGLFYCEIFISILLSFHTFLFLWYSRGVCHPAVLRSPVDMMAPTLTRLQASGRQEHLFIQHVVLNLAIKYTEILWFEVLNQWEYIKAGDGKHWDTTLWKKTWQKSSSVRLLIRQNMLRQSPENGHGEQEPTKCSK